MNGLLREIILKKTINRLPGEVILIESEWQTEEIRDIESTRCVKSPKELDEALVDREHKGIVLISNKSGISGELAQRICNRHNNKKFTLLEYINYNEEERWRIQRELGRLKVENFYGAKPSEHPTVNSIKKMNA